MDFGRTANLYAGQFGIQQEANGLLYMRARYYSPELQRFINGDPARFDGGLNWYAYANNSPLMYVDPDGELPILAVPLLMHAARIVATAAIRRAAPIAARFIARAATRSAAATARNARFVGRATANFGRSSAIQARNLGRAGLNQANFQTFRVNQALRNPSPALREGLRFSAVGLVGAGAANEAFDLGFDSSSFNGFQFGNSSIGRSISTGLLLFSAGENAIKTARALPGLNKRIGDSLRNLNQNFRSNFSTPDFNAPSRNSLK